MGTILDGSFKISLNFLNDLYLQSESFKNLTIAIDSGNDSYFTSIAFATSSSLVPSSINLNAKSLKSYIQSFEATGTALNYLIPKNSSKLNAPSQQFSYLLETDTISENVDVEAILIIAKGFQTYKVEFDETLSSSIEGEIDITPGYNAFTFRFRSFNELYDGAIANNNFVYVDIAAATGNSSLTAFVIPIKIHLVKARSKNLLPESFMDGLHANSFKYNKEQSKYLVRTNPKLAGNIKLVVDSKGKLYFDTFDVDDNTSNVKYKKRPIDPESSYPYDIKRVFSSMPSASMYKVKEHTYNASTMNPLEQYNTFYATGAESDTSNLYDETKRFFAPLLLKKNIPQYFIILAIDNYSSSFNKNSIKDYLNSSRIVKVFSLKEDTNIGKYLKKYITNSQFKTYSLNLNFKSYELSKWFGIDYENGILTSKGEYLYNSIVDNHLTQYQLESRITDGFEKYRLLSSTIINLEFLFDDLEAKPNSIVSYMGFYADENELDEISIDVETLIGISKEQIYNASNIEISKNIVKLDNPDGKIFDIPNISSKIVALKGQDGYYLKVKSIDTNQITIANSKYTLSNLYYYDKSIKQLKVKPVKFDTQPFATIDFSTLNLDPSKSIQLEISYNGSKLMLYGTSIGSNTIPYISYDKLNGTSYICFKQDEGITIEELTSNIIKAINISSQFEASLLDEQKNILVVKAKEAGPAYNGAQVIVKNNYEAIGEVYLQGGGVKGSQVLVKQEDLSYLSGEEVIATKNGIASLKSFDGKFATDYIYEGGDGYKMLTIDSSNIAIDEDTYVYMYIPIKPKLVAFSLYPIADFDYKIKTVSNGRNELADEISLLKDELSFDLGQQQVVSLKPNLIYKLTVDSNAIADAYNTYINGKQVYRVNKLNSNAFSIAYDIAADAWKLTYNGALSSTSFVKLTGEAYTKYLQLTNSEYTFSAAEYDELVASGSNFTYFELALISIPDENDLKSLLLNSINGNDAIPNPSIIVDEYIIYTEDQDANMDVELNLSLEAYDGATFTPAAFDSTIIITNETLLKHDYLVKMITNYKSEEAISLYDDYDSSKVLPTVVKWSYLNSTNTYNDSLWLNISKEYGDFFGTPNLISINASPSNSTYQWFIISDGANKQCILPYDIDIEQFNSTDKDYFSILSAAIGNNFYSTIKKAGLYYYTIFRGVKYKILTSNSIDDYKFAIIAKKSSNVQAPYNPKIIANSKFKFIVAIIEIPINDILVNAYGLTYTFMYGLQHKLSDIYYINEDDFFKFGSSFLFDKLASYDATNFYKYAINPDDSVDITYRNMLIDNLSKYFIAPNEAIEPSFAYALERVGDKFVENASLLLKLDTSRKEAKTFRATSNSTTDFSDLWLYNYYGDITNGFISPEASPSQILPSSYSFYNIKSWLLNAGNSFYTYFLKELQLQNIKKLTDGSITIEYDEPKLLDGIYRYDGLYEVKTIDLIKFSKTFKATINGKSIKISYANAEFGSSNRFELDEFYFNKLSDINLKSYISYYSHKMLASCLDADYYRVYYDNSDAYRPYKHLGLNKNFFNSPCFNAEKAYTVEPDSNLFSVNEVEVPDGKNIQVSFNLLEVVKKYFKNKVSSSMVAGNEVDKFIELNIYKILVIDSIEAYMENSSELSNSIVADAINILKANLVNPKFTITNNIVSFSIFINKKESYKIKVKLNIKHK